MLRIKISANRAVETLLKHFPTMTASTISETEDSYIIALVPKSYDYDSKGAVLNHPFAVNKNTGKLSLFNPLHNRTKIIKGPRRVTNQNRR